MYKGYRYIDNDSHILEPSDLWDKYLESEFRAEAPRTISRWEASEEFDLPSTADRITFHQETHVGGHSFPDFDTGTPQRGMFAMPGFADVYEEYLGDGEFKGMFAPEAYTRVLDRSGIDRRRQKTGPLLAKEPCSSFPQLAPRSAVSSTREQRTLEVVGGGLEVIEV